MGDHFGSSQRSGDCFGLYLCVPSSWYSILLYDVGGPRPSKLPFDILAEGGKNATIL